MTTSAKIPAGVVFIMTKNMIPFNFRSNSMISRKIDLGAECFNAKILGPIEALERTHWAKYFRFSTH